jgi:hypothetical protein
MDPFIKKLLKIVMVKIILIMVIFFVFFNEPSLSNNPVEKEQQIQSHFLNNTENNDNG